MLKFTDALQKAAAKSTVRESDEEQPGRFVAYVDEGAESYDVALELDADRNPLSGRCDCDAKKPCRHMAALFLFVNEGKKVTTKVAPNKGKKKKLTPAEALMEGVDNIALREWLGQALAKNKELELSFMTRFNPAASAYSAEDVTRISEDAIKSILGRGRYVDASQLKRILKLWKDLHKPVVERYRSAPAEQSAFAPINALVTASIKLAEYHHGGIQAVRYAEGVLHELGPVVAALLQDEAFERACGFFIAVMFSPVSGRLPAYLSFAAGVQDAISGDRLRWFARAMAREFQKIPASKRGEYLWHAILILTLVTDADIFEEFHDIFPRIPGRDAYNIDLLYALKNAGADRRALDLGWEMFKTAYYTTPVELILTPLVTVATKLGDREAEIKIRQELFQRTYRLEDYNAVLDAAGDPGVRKKLERKFIALAVSSSRVEAATFLAERNAGIGDWKGLAEAMKRGKVLYSVVLRHFDAMHKYSPELLLAALLDGESPDFRMEDEREAEAQSTVLQRLIDMYGQERLRVATIGTPQQPVRRFNLNVLRSNLTKRLES